MGHRASLRHGARTLDNTSELSRLSIEQDGFPQREPALRFLFESLTQLNHDFDMSRLGDMRALKFDPEPVIKSKMPVLLLGAEDDNGANAALKKIQAAVPHSQLHIVPKAGHLLFFENAQAHNRLVADFLAAMKQD